MKIEEGRTRLIVPWRQGNIVFIHPYVQGTISECGKQIQKQENLQPNSNQTASLVYDSWQNPTGKYESQVIDILKESWMWEFTGNLYLKKGKGDYQNGVILWENLEFDDNGRIKADKQNLMKRLEQNDETVRFVPFGFKTGELKFNEILTHPYMIARYGREGAEKIAKVAKDHYNENKNKPYIWSFKSADNNFIMASALRKDNCRLNIYGYNNGDGYGGYAWGVEKTSKLDSPKI